MFYVVSANPLLDVVYQDPRDALDNRVFFNRTLLKAGGFGPNVGRTLTCLGQPVECHLVTGGTAGKQIRTDLIEQGVQVVNHRGKPSRIAAILVSGASSRMLVSPSPNISPKSLHNLFDRLEEATVADDVILLGGSVGESAVITYVQRIRGLSEIRRFCYCDVRTRFWRNLLSGKHPLVLKLPSTETARLSLKAKIDLLGEAVKRGASLALCAAENFVGPNS